MATMVAEDEGLTVVMTAPQLAAVLEGVHLSERQKMVTRLWGGGQLFFSALQLVGGAAMLLAPDPTLLTKVGGTVLVVHSVDSGGAALHQIWTGQQTEDLTQRAGESVARHMGASPKAAYWWGVGLDVAVPTGVAIGLAAERILAVRGGRISLALEEAAGGHTIEKHVGQSEAAMQARLAAQPKIKAVSTFPSLQVAEDAISQAMSANKAAIRSWAATAAEGSRLRLVYNASSPVGTGIVRATGKVQAMSKVFLVMQRTEIGGKIYFVLTAYPQL
jgi:hypothetical protein